MSRSTARVKESESQTIFRLQLNTCKQVAEGQSVYGKKSEIPILQTFISHSLEFVIATDSSGQYAVVTATPVSNEKGWVHLSITYNISAITWPRAISDINRTTIEGS